MDTGDRISQLVAERPDLALIVKESLEAVDGCRTLEEIKHVRVGLLGKKGRVAAIFRALADLPPDEKRAVGELGNLLRSLVEAKLDEKTRAISVREFEDRLRLESVDVTLPGRRARSGHRHLLSSVIEEITDIFIGLGYSVASGPEVELDYYNFEALNQPAFHPARSLQDTFYVRRKDPDREHPDDIVLRTHTSPVQVRVMESRKPPVYVISPGRAYRRDEIDATHSAVFHQVEGLAVDRGINMGHLKGTLELFAKKFFGEERDVRFRPHFFPFTEPSAEMDVSCFACGAEGCSLCKGVGWLEILGCGMVDPNVFGYVGYDPEEFTGFAFGVGIERIAMMKHGIDDMRLFFENDVRFLEQF